MKIGLAQLHLQKGDIPKNLERHKESIVTAKKLGVTALFFSELSLTSYEPKLARELSLNLSSPLIHELQEISDGYNISLGIGAPLIIQGKIQIGMLLFKPKQKFTYYCKQHLHEDEMAHFNAGNEQTLLKLKNNTIAPAICYESLIPGHLDNVLKLGANIYLASVAKPENGFNRATQYFQNAAKQNAIPILMVNNVGPCDDFYSVGKSCVWSSNGELLIQLNSTDEALLIYDTESESAFSHLLEFNA